MIAGVVTASRQAIIRLTVRGPEGQEQEIEAVIDTGFDGTLTLPPDSTFAATLNLSNQCDCRKARGLHDLGEIIQRRSAGI